MAWERWKDFLLKFWWDTNDSMQISVSISKGHYMLKGTKIYYVVGISERGELLARDLGPFQDYISKHFRRCCYILQFDRDPTDSQIEKTIRLKNIRDYGNPDMSLEEKEEALRSLKNTFDETQTALKDTGEYMELAGHADSSLLKEYLHDDHRRLKQKVQDLGLSGRNLQANIFNTRRLIGEHKRKSISAVLLFRYETNQHIVDNRADFRDALSSIRKEANNYHRYEVSQRLQGSRMGIFVRQMTNPIFALQVELDGFPNLRQLKGHFHGLRQEGEEVAQIYPTEDIKINGKTKEYRKLVVPRVLQNFFNVLDKVQPSPPLPKLPQQGWWLGHVMIANQITDIPFLLPMMAEHVYDSGMSQSGKGRTARPLIEGSCLSGEDILILDLTTKQHCGLGLPNTDMDALSRFDKVGLGEMKEYVRGFPIRIYTPGFDVGLPLPDDLRDLLTGCSVVTLKDQSRYERCKIVRDILQCVYDSLKQESKGVKLRLVIDEAYILQKSAKGESKDIANEAVGLLEQIIREKAKYGVGVLLISQSQKDFVRDARHIRSMIHTRLFHMVEDPTEIDWIAEFLSDDTAKVVKNLRRGEMIVHSPELGISGLKVFVRPSFSSCFEPSDEEIREINDRQESRPSAPNNDVVRRMYEPNEKEMEAVRLVKEHYAQNNMAIRISELMRKMDIRGGSKQRLLNGLVEKNLVEKVQMGGTGRKGKPSQGLIPLT
jgi:predicted transcriptional regulator